ncbi:MAG: histidine--tRNA ligase [Eubacteriales bacterium]|nr:histidine--tRNA ligase [Eubacteriales bacterium]MDD3882239.1 histidine--tRNA ligase [Eubacteriales bacterium]MDD4512588.1 histidine--tRNA ligase [Eubacteriales bacterium]
MLTQAPKGTKDVLPTEIYKWQALEKMMRTEAELAGFREVRTPVFEHTELFLRSIGDTTDVVQKEMYTFKDKGDRSITLKPEGTAGAARAFLEGRLVSDALPCKMYYINNPIFRYENPQAGRLREHHQFGIECYGAKDASADADVITVAYRFFKKLGVKNLTVKINSIGCPECRKAYLETLRGFMHEHEGKLCETCHTRLERNPMRILDCKSPICQQEVKDAPAMLDMLCDECKEHFECLKSLLEELEIPYVIDSRIVRGLDYYTRTVFELITQTEKGELTICGGGRYDKLVEELGGPATCAVGFGMGIERVLMLVEQEGIEIPKPRTLDVYVTIQTPEAKLPAFKLCQQLREIGLKADCDHNSRSLKVQFKFADKTGAPITVVIGQDELRNGLVKSRDMVSRDEELFYIGEAAGKIAEQLADIDAEQCGTDY